MRNPCRPLIALALICSASAAQSPQKDCPVTVKFLSISQASGRYGPPSTLPVELQNTDSKEVQSVELQIDIFDSLRRKTVDRLFVSVDKLWVGHRPIKPGQKKTFTNGLDYRLPRGVGGGFVAAELSAHTLINVIHFSDSSIGA